MMKKIVKFISLVLILSIMLSAASLYVNAESKGTVSLIPSAETVSAGENFTLTVRLSNNPGLISMRLRLNFDESAFTLTGVTDGGLLGNAAHRNTFSSPYTLSWENDTASADITANGDIATLKFTANRDANTGNYAFTLTYTADDILNFNLDSVNFTVNNTAVSIGDNVPAISLIPSAETVSAGENFTLTVKLSNNPGLISMRLRLNFDESAFTLTGVTDGGLLGNAAHRNTFSSPYTLSWENDTASADITANGNIAVLNFTAKENAAAGSYAFNINYAADDILNYNLDSVNFAVNNTAVNIGQSSGNKIVYTFSAFSAPEVRSGSMYLYSGGKLSYSAKSENGTFTLSGVANGSYDVYVSCKFGVLTKVPEQLTVDGTQLSPASDVYIAIGDVNGDGLVDVSDISSILLDGIYATSNADYDIDGSGAVDINDVSTVLLATNYGASSAKIL